ncbi:MAG TPA: hypothetical protein DGG95_00225 [Cytophagales bacterium]|jgi:hypothetical protein|nr:hypothetical protein [Cytophagales bacterium]
MDRKDIPIDVVDLLPVLDQKLIELLKSLSPEEWNKPTVAKLWRVKDVAAHLLDGNIRILSVFRDHYVGDPPEKIEQYSDLVNYLNKLNADWVKAMKRVSPQMLIQLHEITGPLYCQLNRSLKPFDDSPFSVAWAGETVSKNWKHMAREYTEKFLHQQQIREAVNKPGLMTRELFYPFIDTLMLALPHTYRNVKAENGTTVKLNVTTEIGGSWYLVANENQWSLTKDASTCDTEIIIHPDTAWKLFSKSLSPEEIINDVILKGNFELGKIALNMVSVMA